MKPNDKAALPQEKQSTLELPTPGWGYKLSFLMGGIIFSIVTYMAGTLLYELELALVARTVLGWDLLGRALVSVFQKHLLTFTPWLIGTTGVSVGLGYLFDKEVKYRKAAERMAATNGLTLLATRRFFIKGIDREIARAQRGLSNLFSVVMIDVDDFKKYNDSYGHVAGDRALQNVSYIIRRKLRVSDIAGRFGGEEVVVLLAGATKNRAGEVAERLRKEIEEEADVTASIGVASYPDDGKDVENLIQAADEAMYRAKRTGKNKVCLAGSDDGPDLAGTSRS
jgi:diguanylate cyclase (GGDEF)-like protein